MSYIKAEEILPEELIRQIQEYGDGLGVAAPGSNYHLSEKSIRRILQNQ